MGLLVPQFPLLPWGGPKFSLLARDALVWGREPPKSSPAPAENGSQSSQFGVLVKTPGYKVRDYEFKFCFRHDSQADNLANHQET